MWREAAVDARVGPPKLVESSWAVHVAEGSDAVAKFASPACTLGLTLQDAATARDALPAERRVGVELNHAALAALVDGMRRVRDQLAAVSSS